MSWKEGTIGAFCLVGDGAHASIKRQSDGVLYLSCKNFKEGRLDLSSPSYISEEDYAKHFRSDSKALTKPKSGDVLFSIIGTIGEPYIYRESDLFGISSSVSILRPRIESDLLPSFLYYWIRNREFQKAVWNIKGGVAQGYLSLDMIRALPLSLPEPAIQERISSILSTYDDLIENNRRRIQLLEESARLLYREWFVHLRFPGHEHVKIIDGVPEGWERNHLEKYVSIVRGKSYRSTELVEEAGKPFVNLKCLERHGGFRAQGIKHFSGTYKQEQTLRQGDIIIAVTDMTRERHIVAHAARISSSLSDEAVFSMDLVKAVPKNGVNSTWLYSFLRFSNFSKIVREQATGTNVLHLKPQRILDFVADFPKRSLQNAFGEVVQLLIQEQDNLELQNQSLQQARDLLLPRLMNGEITL